ncbi:MAG: PP2C family serine/threonine-protein phosphatase, partial [Gammaproteobacteria bacterium]|nr:PP2C family serine/threonine-protein phosphatase [Gammaproteobacteria bacterium]
CSDGLNNEVADDELAPTLENLDCEDAATELLELSLERGARDNVTLAVIRFESLTGSAEDYSDDTAVNYSVRRKISQAAGWS